MSLYDDATFIYSGEAAAGAPHRAYVMKPVEKLKTTILNANSDLSTSGTLTGTIGDRGFVFADSSTNSSASIANGLLTITTGADGDNTKSRVYTSDGSTTAYLESGKSYNLTYTVVENNGVTDFKYTEDGIIRPAPTEIGTHAVSFKMGEHNSSQYFYLQSQTPSASIVLKDIIVREAEQRSLDFRVTRGSNLAATRVKADGLIEKGRENVLQNSNDFSVAGGDGGWVKGNATVTSGQSGYDGTTNAWKLSSTVSTSFNNIEQKSSNVSGITDYGDKIATFSIFLKKGNTDWARINLNGTGNIYFDLSGDGAVGTASSGNLFGEIEKIGTSGWFRCSVTRLSGGTFTGVLVYVAASDGNLLAADHSESKHIFVQSAQLEYGLVATDYIESYSTKGTAGLLANEPRYDYLTSTNDCPGALLEPGRTNRFPNSEYFGDWSTTITVNSVDQTSGTILTNNAVSPEGLKNATKLQEDGDTTNHKMSAPLGDSFTQGDFYSFSIFAKADGRNKFRFTAGDKAKIDYDATFTLTGSGSVTNAASGTARIEDYGEGWYRCIIENLESLTGVATKQNIFLIHDTDGQNYDGDGTSGVLFYGDQVEEGPWVTSYIPTYGSTVTRTKDAFVSPVDDSEYATDDFTFFIDYKDFKSNGTSSAGLWRALYRDSTRSIFQYNLSVGYHGFPSSTPSTPGSEYSSNHATEGANKIAIVYNRDSVAVYVDGTQTKLDYSVDTTKKGLQFIDLNYGSSKMTVNSIMIFNRPLTKDEAIALTT